MTNRYICPHCGTTVVLEAGQRFCGVCRQLLSLGAQPAVAAPPARNVTATQATTPFASTHVWALLVMGALALDVGLPVVAFCAGLLTWGTVSKSNQALFGQFGGAVGLAAGVLFLIWIYRAHRNLPALGAACLKYSPGWAVGGFFVPFVSLVLPFRVMAEIWKASQPEGNLADDVVWQGIDTPMRLPSGAIREVLPAPS
ncbi:MAG TPA: DUF4328 domain-containing protein [Chloroflexia bacterium]|nr:DUF4328 domain-containing protein [Chloroflexia bacterium]